MYEFNERVREITRQLKSNLYWLPESRAVSIIINHKSISDVRSRLFVDSARDLGTGPSLWTELQKCLVVRQQKVQTKAVLSLPILTKTTSSWLAVHMATNILREKIFKQTHRRYLYQTQETYDEMLRENTMDRRSG